ncbi:ddb1 and cul4 associated factor 7 [Entophlyctis sp. JEL0112]|nr:ddb1 and cul4 associated factor 7 [Entophlyctis sp. JEL0112]
MSRDSTGGRPGAARAGPHTLTYAAPFPVYGLAWAQVPSAFRLAMSSVSLAPAAGNHIHVVGRAASDSDPAASTLSLCAAASVPYPVTKLMWAPLHGSANPNLLCSSSDALRVHEFIASDAESAAPPSSVTDPASGHVGARFQESSSSQGKLVVRATLKTNPARKNGSGSKAVSPPLTAFDWNEIDPNICVTSSIDTTCTVWDVHRQEHKTQLIAHDKAVYDVAFSRNANLFASVGADGSVRLFDLRSLEHSTILYDTPAQLTSSAGPKAVQSMESPPLMRLAWNKLDSNYIATFVMDSRTVVILDVRAPAVSVSELCLHRRPVNAIGWAPHSSAHLCTVADDSYALVWDVTTNIQRVKTDPLLTYQASGPINNLSWTAALPEWVGVAVGDTVQALKM